MAAPVKSQPHADLRVERWREHRVRRREELVTAALQAYEEFGPEANLGQIAGVAGIPKPKIYRHFTDKADLVAAVSDRLRDLVIERLDDQLVPGITVREHLHRCLTAYLDLVAEHPRTMTMLATAPPLVPGTSGPLTESGRVVAQLLSAVTISDLARQQIPTAAVAPLTHALVGAVLGASDWWLRTPDSDRIEVAELVEHLTVVILGAGAAALQVIGVALDPDSILPTATLIRPAEGGTHDG